VGGGAFTHPCKVWQPMPPPYHTMICSRLN